MMLYIYGLKNRLSGIFERPFAEPYDAQEYCDVLQQSLALASVDDLSRHAEYDVYSLGSIDNKSGEIVSSIEFVMSLETLCKAYILLKEKKDSKDESIQQNA